MTLTDNINTEQSKKKATQPHGWMAWGCLTIVVLFFVGRTLSTIDGVANPTKNNDASPAKTAEQVEAEKALKAEERKQDVSAISDAFCKNRQGEYSYGYFFCGGCVDLKTIATYLQLSQGESTTLSDAKIPAKKEDCDKVADLCLDYWSNKECLNMAEHKLWLGMSETQLKITMGIPDDKNNTVGGWGVHSQWVYGDSTYVYLEGKNNNTMVVTSWQD